VSQIALAPHELELQKAIETWAERHDVVGSARRAIERDGPDPALPDWWASLADAGWLGLHVPESHGGSGASLYETAIFLETLGGVCAPGPALSSVLLSAVICEAGTDGQRSSWLPRLAAGSAVGTVDVVAGGFRGRAVDGGGVVASGRSDVVLSGHLADVVLLPIVVGHDERWFLVRSQELTCGARSSLDQTRPVAWVELDGVTLAAGDEATGVTRRLVETVAGLLVAAEATGAATWCLQTATDYAKVREQFGRPIGQFQAVKHRCADMLVTVESMRAVAWNGLRTAGEGEPDEQALVGSSAAALALDGFYRCARDCVQVLGGIGFTWEHDAHIYLKRATTLRLLFGPGDRWFEAAGRLTLQSVRPSLRLELPAEAEQHRIDGRRFADEVKDLAPADRRKRFVDSGYLEPHWPKPWGRDATAVEQIVIDQELRRAGVARDNLGIGAWVVPTLITYGTPEQQERWIPGTLYGLLQWCQLFSEPDAGSDLAALSTRAVAAPDGWLLTGQKIWSSMTDVAHWGICLARTDPEAPKHDGITYFVVDMASPGLDVRPLREMTGGMHFSEVFLDDVFVPDDCVVGEVHQGWRLARHTLTAERVTMGDLATSLDAVGRLVDLVGDDPGVAPARWVETVGRLTATGLALESLSTRTAARALVDGGPNAVEASIRKLSGAEHQQRLDEFALELLGPAAVANEGEMSKWLNQFLFDRCLTIAGGTSEVQRNLIAERLLGLPRDP